MSEENSVKFIGNSGLLYTDENSETFCVYTETLPYKKSCMVMYAKDIMPLYSNRELTENERETIVEKILELTQEINWQFR